MSSTSLKKFKPTTPSQRHTVLLNRYNLAKVKPLKSALKAKKNKAGRNSQGRLTVFTKGGGHKRLFREILFTNEPYKGIVEHIEYDPNRTAMLARLFLMGENRHKYILAPLGVERGHLLEQSTNSSDNRGLSFKIGNSYKLSQLPLGVFVHNFSFFPALDKKICRSAGVSAQIISKDSKFCRIRLASGEHRLFPLNVIATLGIVSNPSHKLISLGKAGRSRWLNKRPVVRGVAMNPIDHPHGGGEGKTSGGRPSVTPWGKPTKGQPTRKRPHTLHIVKKRKNG